MLAKLFDTPFTLQTLNGAFPVGSYFLGQDSSNNDGALCVRFKYQN